MISYGIDIGTTTARALAVRIIFDSFKRRSVTPVGTALCVFTPFLPDGSLDETGILTALRTWAASLPPPEVGTLLFTGEAQRAVNCLQVSRRLSAEWRGLLCAQLDPQWESMVAAHGSGAVALSQSRPGQPVLHIDIGGGTSNFAWIENGSIADTACLDLGARKWILDPSSLAIRGRARNTPAIERLLADRWPGSSPLDLPRLRAVCDRFAEWILDFRRFPDALTVSPWKRDKPAGVQPLYSISGGVAACDPGDATPFRFGDLGPLLRGSLASRLGATGVEARFGDDSGRATALGVSAFGFQLSGRSIHAPQGLAFTDLRLVTEADWGAAVGPGAGIAVQLELDGTGIETLRAKCRQWQSRLKGTTGAVVFLLRENVGKSLGYLWESEATAPAATVYFLDEIELDQIGGETGLRTIDLRPMGADRYTVIVKALRRF